MLLSSTILGTSLPARASASQSKSVPSCLNTQLEVAVAWAAPPAAGNNGIPFIIANDSKVACSIVGYPRLSFVPDSYKGRSITVIKGGGMIFRRAKPRLVIVEPDGTASFGLDYGDAANQQDPAGAPCLVQNVYVTLPVRYGSFPQNYETTAIFNFCFTNFRVSVTSIQPGPLPKQS